MGFWKWLGLSVWKRLRKIKPVNITKEDIAIGKVIFGVMGGAVILSVLSIVRLCSPRQFELFFGLASVSGLLFLIGLHGVYQIEGEDC